MDNEKSNFRQYKVLDKVNKPADMKSLSSEELHILCDEVRHFIIESVKKTGGHLAPSLGTIELIVAMHYVFDTPQDKIIWDVGHQAYAHKVLTGRKDKMNTIRQYGGISGFLKIHESEYDAFGAGHASTSISAAIGFVAARNLKKESNRVVAIIGDGSFTGGLALEGMNNVCNIDGQFLTILNDNEMSISPNVGAISKYLTKILRNPKYIYYKNRVWNFLENLPRGSRFFRKLIAKLIVPIKKLLSSKLFFEEFNLRYYGPINGHDLNKLIMTFENIKNLNYPVLLHIRTKKGKGLPIAEKDPTKYHGISPITSGKAKDVKEENNLQFLEAFGKITIELAEKYKETVLITAAMKDGTGLVEYADKFPDRYYDVGIAEGHAVTFAAGLAAGGARPVAAIYSTFLQRAYDNVFHDIALQHLPVVFALDRAGVVGADGPTHHGAYDLSFLNTIPEIIIAAPRNGNEMRDMFFTAFSQKDKPFAIRYPKDSCVEFDENRKHKILEIGAWEILKKGKNVAIISNGVMTNNALDSLKFLEKDNIKPTVIHAKFIKPFDEEMFLQVAKEHKLIITVEENTIMGGMGMTLTEYLNKSKLKSKIYCLALPDEYIPQGKRKFLLEKLGLSPEGIANFIRENS